MHNVVLLDSLVLRESDAYVGLTVWNARLQVWNSTASNDGGASFLAQAEPCTVGWGAEQRPCFVHCLSFLCRWWTFNYKDFWCRRCILITDCRVSVICTVIFVVLNFDKYHKCLVKLRIWLHRVPVLQPVWNFLNLSSQYLLHLMLCLKRSAANCWCKEFKYDGSMLA